MAALTAARDVEFEGEQEEISPKVAASDIYYKGGILVYTSGYAAAPSDAANLEVAGVESGIWEDGDRVDAKTIAASTYTRQKLRRGKVWIPVENCAQTDVGVIHYVLDDSTMTKTASSKTVGYRALDFKTGKLLFDFRNPDRIA
jgi:hypothetical protein